MDSKISLQYQPRPDMNSIKLKQFLKQQRMHQLQAQVQQLK
jgi:hypothetical protein